MVDFNKEGNLEHWVLEKERMKRACSCLALR